MKGTIIFNQLNDILFIYTDSAFKQFLTEKLFQDQLIPEKSSDQELNLDAVIQFFSTLINSFRFMNQYASNPYQSIYLDNNFLFVFEQHYNQVWVSFCGDGNEDETKLRQKLKILRKIIILKYGPIFDELKPTDTAVKNHQWLSVSNILQAWQQSYSNDLSYLVEAVECLHVNQTLKTKCSNVLQAVANKFKLLGEKDVVHFILLVGNKLLSLYSRKKSAALCPSDLLLVILMNQAWLSKLHLSQTEQECHKDLLNNSYEILNSDAKEEEELFEAIKTADNLSYDGGFQEADKFFSQNIFLNINNCEFMPHRLQIIPLKEGISLVTINSIKNQTFLSLILNSISFVYQVLDCLNRLTPPKITYNKVESCMKSLLNEVRKYELATGDRQIYYEILKCWEQGKKDKLREYFAQNSEIDQTRLESSLNLLLLRIKLLFKKIYSIENYQISHSYSLGIEKIQSFIFNQLAEFLEYIRVKLIRNLTLTSFIEEFPGLVHFIYINRSTNFLLSPTLEFSLNGKNNDFIKAQVWKWYLWCREKQISHYDSISFRVGDLYFTSLLWLEDSLGNKLQAKVLPQEILSVDCNEIPSVISGDYYRKLLKQSCPQTSNQSFCYELFCTHLGLVSPKDISQQSFKLAEKLWEFSGHFSFNYFY